MDMMLALVKEKEAEGLGLKKVPVPQPDHNDVLVKIIKTAICGTDVHIYNWNEWARKTIPPGLVIGHEFYGIVVARGDQVEDIKIGTRVSGEGHIVCGHCRNCLAGRRHLCKNTRGIGVNRDGAFAQYLCIPQSNVWQVADNIDDDVAACFDPLGNATHTALTYDLVGEDVLVTGAGPIGIMAATICRHVGARHVVITDINNYRLELAAKLGIRHTVNPRNTDLRQVLRDLQLKEGFDVGLEMSGSARALQDMIEVMYHGGKIALLGIPEPGTAIDWQKLVFNGLMLKGIYGREMYETWYKMTTMLQSGLDIAPLITHRLPVWEYKQGFDLMRSGISGKVILDWTVIYQGG